MNKQEKSENVLHVFLCHTEEDMEKVRTFYHRLRADGFNPWFEEEDLKPGQNTNDTIKQAVKDSYVIVVFLTKEINKPGFIHKQLTYALDVAEEQPPNSIFIIPALLEPCDIPARLKQWHPVNLYDKDGYEQLRQVLRILSPELLSPPPSLPPPPRKIQWTCIALGVVCVALLVAFLWVQQPQKRPIVSNLVEVSDFSISDEGWSDVVVFNSEWNSLYKKQHAALLPEQTGEHGLTFNLPVLPGERRYFVIDYIHPEQERQADIVVADVYIPETNVKEAWVSLQAMSNKRISLAKESIWKFPLGKWVRLFLDLRGRYDMEDNVLTEQALAFSVVYGLQGRDGVEPETTVQVRLADVTWYKIGSNSVNEFRARYERRIDKGRTLFDFEDKGNRLCDSDLGSDSQCWYVTVPTNTLALSEESVYRGKQSLKWETQIGGANKSSTLRIELPVTSVQGGWVAQVYVPEDTDAHLWVNFFTKSEQNSDWYTDNEANKDLKKGSWTTLFWNTHDVDWGTRDYALVGIQIGVRYGESYTGPIYLDDIQFFER